MPNDSDDNVIPFDQYRGTPPSPSNGGDNDDGAQRPRRPGDSAKDIECAEMRREAIVQVGHGMKERGWTVDSPPDAKDMRWEAEQNMSFQGARMGKRKVHPLAKTAYFHSNADPKEHFSSDMNPAAARAEREYQLKKRLAKQRQFTSTPRPQGS